MMYVLSSWIGSGSHTDPYRPAFADAYKGVGWAQMGSDNYAVPGRICLQVINPPATLLTDWRFPAVPTYPFTVADYKQTMLAAIETWSAVQVANGITVPAGITLPATVDEEAWLTSLATAMMAALTVKSKALTDTVTVYDASYGTHTVTIQAFLTNYASYINSISSFKSTRANKRQAILAAATIADLDAVSLPS